MTEPKVPSGDGVERRPLTATQRQEESLRQLVKLTASVEKLAMTTITAAEPSARAAVTAELTPEVRKVLFAYTLLGEQLGRREADFKVLHVGVNKGETDETPPSRTLTFVELPDGGDTALLRARNGQVEVLEDLQAGEAKTVVDIPTGQRIDEIVILDDRGGVPLATACPRPSNLE